MNYRVIIPAAGQGKRMGLGYNKLFLPLGGRALIAHTLDVFLQDSSCETVILSTNEEERELFLSLSLKGDRSKITFVNGGVERQHSVANGLSSIDAKEDTLVLVHDGARPFITREVIAKVVQKANDNGAAIVGVPVKDTIKRIQSSVVQETIDRSSLWQIQTPQAFRLSILHEAHQWARVNNYLGTDEASLVEKISYPVSIVEGSYDNIKLTTKEDIYFGEAILQAKSQEEKQ
ncbi:2-C-methyl-D-erythritol 4-phosphate cytidylyltransferase [Mangrovibacillus cuniculi]|uniref:2-C-methyl-D-erythritol 4-phosphate cytidylyltransferase n=1 Tax=Mangrovibacillus cuniculi TaxID=2593652 RepID=A0A7S8CDW9_9BACI|nr:2-C-methyl-D-erythritol 4-phosphate cytidylyltransferase [Mangrovibacillus cuniculi]QPC48013.1 2-C-methyl-D-erythritol 4-phosphate cytidylyltransferase [Mangrovibacillus cuniculi]